MGIVFLNVCKMADKEFAQKKILVTGVGGGIGRVTALKLASLGAEVYGISRTAQNLESLKKECPSINTICQDIGDWNGTRAAVEKLPAMDGLVNNAGINTQQSFLEVTEDKLDSIWNVNFKSSVNISQIVAKKMIENGKEGSIVNVSSQASIKPIHNHTVYCASKAAMDHVGRVMALELGPKKIRTNAVNPTVVMTDMGRKNWSDPEVAKPMLDKIPLGKFAEPEDVAEAIIFLLSDKSKMLNGISMPVDGGFCAV